MRSDSLALGDSQCLVCRVDAYDHSARNEAIFLGKTVKLDCGCMHYYHLSCLKEQWRTSLTPSNVLEVDKGSREYWRIYADMVAGGVDPETYEFEDIPLKRGKCCPVCSRKVVGFADVVEDRALPSNGEIASGVTTDSSESKHAEAPEAAAKIATAVRKGKSFTMQNTKALLRQLREDSLLSPDLSVDETKLIRFIRNQLAETDMADRESQKRVVAFLQASEASPAPVESRVSPPRPCSQLTVTDIREWVDEKKSTGVIDNGIDLEIELLESFIKHELRIEDFDSDGAQSRVLQFIASQVGS